MKDKAADRYITIQGVAETLGCTERHVYSLIQEGSIKAIKIGERALRISEQSLKAFIAGRTVNPEDLFAPEDESPQDPGHPPKVAKSNWMNR